MGQLVYDNLFWDKAAKDLGMASVRSLGWNLGTFRELGGGAFDAGKAAWDALHAKKPTVTHRIEYTIALPILIGLLGAIYMYLRTGQETGRRSRITISRKMAGTMPMGARRGIRFHRT